MSIDDLAEGSTETEAPVAVWKDNETDEIIFQYGYVNISMPQEDFAGFLDILNEARNQIEKYGS